MPVLWVLTAMQVPNNRAEGRRSYTVPPVSVGAVF